MYRILVADDEIHVVNWVTELLNNRFSDLEVIQVGNGKEVLQVSKTMTFDLAILDIMMPGFNGIQAAKQILEKLPSCRILLLTGYNEFDLIYQVNDIKNIRYSLKTEADEQIIQKVQEMIDDLDEEQRQRQIIDNALRKEILLQHFEGRGILYDILFESASGQSMQTKFDFYGTQLPLNPKNPVGVTLIQFSNHNAVRHVITNDLLIRLYRNLEKSVEQFFHFAMLDINRDCVLLLTQPKSVLETSSWASILKTELDRSLMAMSIPQHQAIRFYIYSIPNPWRKVQQSYNYLLQYCRSHNVDDTMAPVFGSIVSRSSQAKRNGDYQQEIDLAQSQYFQSLQKLSAALVQGDSVAFCENMNIIYKLSPILYKMTSLRQAELRGELSLVFINYINLHHLQNELEQRLSSAPLYQAMADQDWNELLTYTQQLSSEIFVLMKEKVKNDSVHTVQRICSYIDGHLSENLSVTRLSEIFNYNQSYISRLFKQVRGENLSQYLKAARLNRAKELLRTSNLSIQEVADAVGFDTVQYFSMVFRKEVGMTPKSFRNSAELT